MGKLRGIQGLVWLLQNQGKITTGYAFKGLTQVFVDMTTLYKLHKFTKVPISYSFCKILTAIGEFCIRQNYLDV